MFCIGRKFDGGADIAGAFNSVLGAAFVGIVILAVFVKDDEGDGGFPGGDFGLDVEIVAGIGDIFAALDSVGAKLVFAD